MNGSGTILGHLLALKAIARPRARARHEWKLDAIKADRKNTLWYREELRGVVRLCRGETRETMDRIRPEIEHRNKMVGDAVRNPFVAEFERLASRFGHVNMAGRRLAKLAAEKNAGSADDRLAAEIQRAMGVDLRRLFKRDERLAAVMERQAAENVRLITSIPEQYLEQVKDVVSQGWARGARWESMVEDIAQIGDLTDSRAELIAVDQTSKMNAAFNEARQTQVGIEQYDWMDVGDERVRTSHWNMRGSRCRWDSPPLVDGEHVHPGEAIRCRCGARPVFAVIEQAEAA